MITKNETHEPRKIHGLYRHDSGAESNCYEAVMCEEKHQEGKNGADYDSCGN